MKLHSLTFKIPLIMGLSITLSIFVITVIMFLISLKSVDIAAQNGFETTAIAYESTANLWIEQQQSIVDAFSTNDSIVNFLLNRTEENTLATENSLTAFKNYRKSSLHFVILDTEGNILLDSEEGNLIRINQGVDPDFNLYKNNVKDEKMWISKSSITGKPVFKMYSDINAPDGTKIGVLSYHIDWEDFMRHSISNYKFGDTGSIMIIDEDKNIVAHKDESKVLTNMKDSEVLKDITDLKTGIKHFKNDDGKLYMLYFNTIIYPHWYIIVTIAESELYNPVKFMLILPIVVGVILTILSIIIIWCFSKHVISPINEAVKEAENIANGDLTAVISEKYLNRKDEIGEILNSFNKMIGRFRFASTHLQLF